MDGYKKIKHLADGNFGKAYLYERKSDKLQVVMKVINMAEFSPTDTVESMREVKVLKKLIHPNIVRFEDVFKDGTNMCIVMEYCEAGDLHIRVMSDDNIEDKQKWDWFVQICKALQFMHSSKVIHRDLKPSNVFISQDGTLRIGGFGLAKVFLHSDSLYDSNQADFGIAYGAPEMLDDLPFTDKSDVWSLGCVFYFMVMRTSPFTGRSPVQIMIKVMNGTYDPIPSGHDANMRDLIDRLLTKDPEQRPSVTEVLAIDYVKAYAQPTQMLLSVYGHAVPKIDDIDAKVACLDGVCEDLQEKLIDQAEELGAANREIASLKQSVERQRRDLAARTRELGTANVELSSLKQSVEQQRRDLAARTRELGTANVEIARFRQSMEQQRRDLTARTRALQEVSERQEETERKLAQLQIYIRTPVCTDETGDQEFDTVPAGPTH